MAAASGLCVRASYGLRTIGSVSKLSRSETRRSYRLCLRFQRCFLHSSSSTSRFLPKSHTRQFSSGKTKIKRGRLRKKRTAAGISKNERIKSIRRRTEGSENFHFKQKRHRLRLIQEYEFGYSPFEKSREVSPKDVRDNGDAVDTKAPDQTMLEELIKEGKVDLYFAPNIMTKRLHDELCARTEKCEQTELVTEAGQGIFAVVRNDIMKAGSWENFGEPLFATAVMRDIKLLRGASISSLALGISEEIVAKFGKFEIDTAFRWTLDFLNAELMFRPGKKSPKLGNRTSIVAEKVEKNLKKSRRFLSRRKLDEIDGENLEGLQNLGAIRTILLSPEIAAISADVEPLSEPIHENLARFYRKNTTSSHLHDSMIKVGLTPYQDSIPQVVIGKFTGGKWDDSSEDGNLDGNIVGRYELDELHQNLFQSQSLVMCEKLPDLETGIELVEMFLESLASKMILQIDIASMKSYDTEDILKNLERMRTRVMKASVMTDEKITFEAKCTTLQKKSTILIGCEKY